MGVATRLQQHLSDQGIDFTVIPHPYAESSTRIARVAGVPPSALAKAVLFRDEDFNYTLAVIPAANKVRRYTINQIFDRRMELADEDELQALFSDCREGAVPPLGRAYNVHVIWDDALAQADHVWIEAGDHEHLLRLSVSDFVKLMLDSPHEYLSSDQPYCPPPKPGPNSYLME